MPEVTLPSVPRLTALEHDFPAAALSRLAEHESWREELHRPATCTHKWWAKRLGTVFRGILCSAVTHDDISAMEAFVTDPPYMDNVHYSELADFFHAWLRELRPFPGYPVSMTTRSSDEVQSASAEEFQKTITSVWRECSRVLRDDGLMAFTFHQARLSGWVALMLALADAGFIVTAVQPVKGEMSTSVAKNAREPSNLDAIIVCRKRSAAPCDVVTDAHRAADMGTRRLAELQSAGIGVGPADIRSVIRGHVLATYTASPQTADIEALAAVADRLAAQRAARLQPGTPGQETSH